MALGYKSRSLFVSLLEFVYPPACLLCNRRMDPDAFHICPSCRSEFVWLQPADPLWVDMHNRFRASETIRDFISCYKFEQEGKIQHAIHALKYSGMKSIGVLLGEELGRRIQEHESLSRADSLIPIPLHRVKQRERGYNQSESICRGISSVTGQSVESSILRRWKQTESQTQLTIDERAANVGDAFEIDPRKIPESGGKTYILVDDVITTGSTIVSCAKVLRAHGAVEVYAASIALAP